MTNLTSDEMPRNNSISDEEIELNNDELLNTENNTNDKRIILNELLTYLVYYINECSIINIKKVINDFFTNSEILEAKNLLWEECKDHLGEYIARKNSNNRQSSEANVEDIIDAIFKLEQESKLPEFAAKNIERLPDKQPDGLSLMHLIDKVNNIERKVRNNLTLLTNYGVDLMEIKDKFIANKCQCEDIKMPNKSNDDQFSYTENKANENNINSNGFINNVRMQVSSHEMLMNCSDNSDLLNEDRHLTDINSGIDNEFLDEDILRRYRALKNPDDGAIKNDNHENKDDSTLDDTEFEAFLDNFDDSDIKTTSISEFKRYSRSFNNDSLVEPPEAYKDNYSDVLKRSNQNSNQLNNPHSPPLNARTQIRVKGHQPNNFPKKLFDHDGFELKESRSALRSRLRQANSVVGFSGAPLPMENIWVYRVVKGNTNTVTDHLKSRNIAVNAVQLKSKPESRYKSFKVTVFKKDLNKLLDSDFWPEGVMCRIWKDYVDKKSKSISFFGKKYKNIKFN